MLYCDGIYVYEGVPDDDVKYNKWSDRWPVNSDHSVFIYLFYHNWCRDQDHLCQPGVEG